MKCSGTDNTQTGNFWRQWLFTWQKQ